MRVGYAVQCRAARRRAAFREDYETRPEEPRDKRPVRHKEEALGTGTRTDRGAFLEELSLLLWGDVVERVDAWKVSCRVVSYCAVRIVSCRARNGER